MTKKKVPILLQTSSAQVFRDTNTVSHPHTQVAELASCTMSSRPWHYTHRSYHRADCNPACESPREGDVAAAFWERYKWLDTGAGLQTKELLWFLELRKFLELLLKKKKNNKVKIYLSIYQRAGRRLRKIETPYWKTYMMFTHLTSESPKDACCTNGKTAADNSL